MWREDDFEDKGKRIKVVLNDKAGELINHTDLEPEVKAERADVSAQD